VQNAHYKYRLHLWRGSSVLVTVHCKLSYLMHNGLIYKGNNLKVRSHFIPMRQYTRTTVQVVYGLVDEMESAGSSETSGVLPEHYTRSKPRRPRSEFFLFLSIFCDSCGHTMSRWQNKKHVSWRIRLRVQ